MNLLRITLIILLFSYSSYAQIELKGVVKDSSNVAVEFANVVLTNQKNEIVKGTITDEKGEFSLSVKKGSYKLLISFLGYEDWVKEITLDDSYDFGIVILEESKNNLDEVVITAEKPRITQKIDRIEFTIENSVLKDDNLWNVISKSPGIVTSIRGDIQMFGKNNVLVYIDNKPIRLVGEELMSLLEGMQANNVISLEIIDTPPSNYDAQGGGVINIKIKKQKDLGLNGNINSTAKFAIFPKFNNGISLNYLKKGFSVYSNYTYGVGVNNGKKERKTEYFQDNSQISNWDENSNLKSGFNIHNYRFVIDASLSNRSTLSFTTNGNIPNINRQTNTNTSITQLATNDFLNTLNNTNSISKNFSNSLLYELKFRKRDKLSFEIEKVDYTSDIDENVDTNGSTSLIVGDFRSESNQEINIVTVKSDYVHIINSTKIELGVKGAFTNSINDLDYFNTNGNVETVDLTRSNDFEYAENIYAAYFNYAKNFEKISIKVGIRGEYTETKGYSRTLDQINVNNYFRIFPTFYISYDMKKSSSLRFAYGRRISRPNFGLLNPFRFYYSAYSFIEGNPFLLPSFTDNFSLTYTLKGKHFFKYYLNFTDDPFTQVSFQDNDNQTYRYLAVNLNNNLSTGVSIFSRSRFKNWWSLSVQGNAYYKRNSFISQQNNNINNSNWNLDVFITNNFYPTKRTSIEVFTRYLSPKIQGAFQVKARHEFSVGFSHRILKNKGRLSLYISDVLNGTDYTLNTRYEDQSQVFFDDRENQYVRLGFSYQFGDSKKDKKPRRTNRSIQNEKERI